MENPGASMWRCGQAKHFLSALGFLLCLVDVFTFVGRRDMEKITKLPAADCFGKCFTACGPHIWKGWQHIMFVSCTLAVPNVKNIVIADVALSLYKLIF